MKKYTIRFEIHYFSGTVTGGSRTVESANIELAKRQAMNIVIDNIRKTDKSENLKEIIITQAEEVTT